MKFQSLVSVIMPVYNAELYLKQSIESILKQTYHNIELFIFDDNSTDTSIRIITSFSDERIRLIKKPQQTGYTDSLIEGIKIASGKYIARMDSDDVSHPTRLEKQVAFLEANHDYGIVGAFVQTIQSDGKSHIWKYPVNDEEIRSYTIANAPFAHPSVMMKKQVLIDNGLTYNKSFEPCEDYKLWVDLLKVTKGKNINEILLEYRLHPHQTIATRKQTLINKSNDIRQIVLQSQYQIVTTPNEILQHYYYFNELQSSDAARIKQFFNWRKKLLSGFKQKSNALREIRLVEDYWCRLLGTITEYRLSSLLYLMTSTVWRKMSFLFIIKFMIKSVIHYKVSPSVIK